MSHEWDFPPQRQQWREEEFVRPSRRSRFERVIDHEPKPKSLWQWYMKRMRGSDPLISKIIATMLLATFWLFLMGIGAIGTIIALLTIETLMKS